MHDMHTIQTEITEFEKKLRANGIPLGSVLDEAGVNRSTWSRWKQGKTVPTLPKWRAIFAVADRLIPVTEPAE